MNVFEIYRQRLTGKRELYQRIASDLLEAVYRNFVVRV